MQTSRKLKLAKLKKKHPEPVVVDMSEVNQAIKDLAESIQTIQNYQESHTQAFSEHLTKLEGIIEGTLKTNNTEPIARALDNIKIVSNTKPEIKIPKIDVPAPQVKIVNTNNDIYATYKASDADVGEESSYYGFIDSSGNWFILRRSGSDSASFRYAFGNKDYKDNWLSREKIKYGYYNES